MQGHSSPDLAGFHESVATEPRQIKRTTRLQPFHFRGKRVEIQRVAIVQGILEPNNSPIPQRTNTIYSAYNADDPNTVYGQARGELQDTPQGKVLSLTDLDRQHPTRGVIRGMLRELVERGEVQTINTRGEGLSGDSQRMAKILESEAKSSGARFTIDVERDRDDTDRIVGFTMKQKPT